MTTTNSHRRRFALPVASAALAMTGLVGSLVAPVAPVAAQQVIVPTVPAVLPSIDWQPCRDGFECARVPVPLDYDRPDGATISLSVIRKPAGDASRRIGNLFMNPGGPGGSGVDIVRGLAQFLPLELRERFDIVGFDPRGILRSTPLRCYRTFDEVFEKLPFFAYPVTRRQENRQEAYDRSLARACRKHAGPIKRHMSTADVARDMDSLRQASGDSQLNYLGYSYGSALGQTYANLFPDNGRAIVIDGVLDPEAWAGVARGHREPVGSRLRSGVGAKRTLKEFFRLCDEAGTECRFSGDSKRRWNRLVRKFQNDPAFVRRVGGGYSDFIAVTLGALYAPFIWPELASFYRFLEREASRERIAAQRALMRDQLGLAAGPQEEYPNFIEGFPGVVCSDGINPRDYGRWRRSADRAQEEQGHFGRLWSWTASACAFWPRGAGQDQHLGPWNATTANPVLVVGNRYDPATPYTGARAAARLLPNSRLLTYAGWGHTAFFSGNFCVDAEVTRYLLTTTVPARGTVCQPAGSPFGRLSARSSASAELTAAIAGTLPLPVRRALDR